MKSTFLSMALLLGSFQTFAASSTPVGDTVVVKMKNKNKVIILTEKNKDMKSLKNLQFDKIMMQVDSSLGNLDSLIQLRVNVDIGDSTTVIENLPGEKKIKIVKTMNLKEMEDLDEMDGDGEKKIVRIMVRNGDTVRSEIIRRKIEKKPKFRLDLIDPDDDMFELDLGFNNYLQNGSLPGDNGAAYGLSPFNSNIVNLRWMGRVTGKPGRTRFSGSFGLELSWHNYKFDEDKVIGKDRDSVRFDPFDAGQKKIKSKLTIAWLNVPLMLHYNAKKSSFHMGLGGFAGYRLGSHSKTKFTEDGVTKKEKNYTNFYLNSLQYGLRFQVGFYDVDFFASYNLNELFSSGKGPKLTPISFGITL